MKSAMRRRVTRLEKKLFDKNKIVLIYGVILCR